MKTEIRLFNGNSVTFILGKENMMVNRIAKVADAGKYFGCKMDI